MGKNGMWEKTRLGASISDRGKKAAADITHVNQKTTLNEALWGRPSKDSTDPVDHAQVEEDRLARTKKLNDMPQLQDRGTLKELGAAGQFQASTVANPENSPWQQMAMKQQGINQGMAGDALAKNNAIAAAQGRATVAGGRGPSSGGMERAGQANMQSLAAGREGLNATGGQQRQAIAQQAGAKGLATAQFNTGQMNQAEQANIGAQRADTQQQNAFNQLKYGEQMKYKSGQLSGDAISKSGGKK